MPPSHGLLGDADLADHVGWADQADVLHDRLWAEEVYELAIDVRLQASDRT